MQRQKVKSHGFCTQQGRRWNDAKSNIVSCIQWNGNHRRKTRSRNSILKHEKCRGTCNKTQKAKQQTTQIICGDIICIVIRRQTMIKGYEVPDGFMGLVKGKYQLFASETEYYEYMLENKEV